MLELSERVFRKLGILEQRDRLIRVKSWKPAVYRYRDRLQVTWPCMLIDRYGFQRCTTSPVWDRGMFRSVFAHLCAAALKARSHE